MKNAKDGYRLFSHPVKHSLKPHSNARETDMKHIKMNKKGWQIVDEQIRQAKKDGHVAWTVHHEDGTVTLEISGVAKLKLIRD